MNKKLKLILGLSLSLLSINAYAVTWDELEAVKTSEGSSPFEGCNESISCELLAEEGRYSVVQTQLGRDCESGGIWVVNAKNKQAVFMPKMTNCDFDIEKNAVVIYPQQGYANIYQGSTNATPSISEVELP
ncbi:MULTISPECIES: hypothetical protein [Proteus]|uniref:hypothetical protein n=1 Tax=Proteus TaxID=583 RepID=UPI0018E79B7B|nr:MULTISPECIES: hypothetical protein [Proteus]MBJ2110609.1 hypothetical protein [Proteus terrae]MBJ2133198.1 hypothetical protein [Proteus terrae]UPK81455.1 hypothetical protein LW139_01765 [Proteus vulgaris]